MATKSMQRSSGKMLKSILRLNRHFIKNRVVRLEKELFNTPIGCTSLSVNCFKLLDLNIQSVKMYENGDCAMDSRKSFVTKFSTNIVNFCKPNNSSCSNLISNIPAISSEDFHDESTSDNDITLPMAWAFLYAALFSQKSQTKPEEDELILLLKMAQLEQHRGENKKAMTLYHQALRMLAERGKNQEMDETEVTGARVTVFDHMANLSLSLNQLAHAERLFKETLRGLMQLGRPQNDDSVVEISLKLAMIYAMMGRDREAEVGYKYCVQAQEAKVNEGGFEDSSSLQNAVALLGMVVNSYARFLMVQQRMTEALTFLQQAVELCERAHPDDVSPQLAVLYNDLATIYSTKGDNLTAKEYFLKAIELGEEHGSEDLATYLELCVWKWGSMKERWNIVNAL